MNRPTITIQPVDKVATSKVISGLPADLVVEDQHTNDYIAFLYVRNAFENALKNAELETAEPVFFPWFLQEENATNDRYSYVTVMRRTAWEGMGVLSTELYRKEGGYALYCTPLNNPTMLEIAIQTHLHCIVAGWSGSKEPEPWLVSYFPLSESKLEDYGDMPVYRIEFEHSS